jgi:ribosomal protein L35
VNLEPEVNISKGSIEFPAVKNHICSSKSPTVLRQLKGLSILLKQQIELKKRLGTKAYR